MLGKEHAVFGFVTSATVWAAFMAPDYFIPTVACGVVGALLPDIDLPNSTMGKIVRPISWLINKLFGHRTITHDLALWIPIGIFFIWKFQNALVLGLVIGYWGHLFLDSFTAEGIPMLWILKGKNFHMLPYKWKLYASSFTAKVLTVSLSLFMSTLIFAVAIVIKGNSLQNILTYFKL